MKLSPEHSNKIMRPIVAKGTPNIDKICFKSSSSWNSVQKLNLHTNMMAHVDRINNDFPK